MEYYKGERLQHMGDLPSMAASRYGDKTAFIFMGQETTYNEFETDAKKVGSMLTEHGVEPGDRVGLFIPNSPQFPVAFFGAIKAGAVPVPLNLRMDPETLVFVLNNSETDHVIGSPYLADEVKNLAEAASPEKVYVPGMSDDEKNIINYSHAMSEADPDFETVERDYDDVAVQPYTSGTTGEPKGVMLTHQNLLTAIESYSKGTLGIDADDSILLVLPLFHIYGLNALMSCFVYRGTKIVLQPRPEPDKMLGAIDEHNLTKFAGVPAMYNMMFREYRENTDEYDLSSLEHATCAAAPLAEDTRKKIEEAWNVPVVEGWGMTETSPAGTLEPPRGVRKEAGCIGPPLPNMELKIVDPESRETIVSHEDLEPAGMAHSEIDFEDHEAVTGELAIRGPQVFKGYYNRPEKTEEVFDDEGWFYTQDIMRVDSDGYFWMVDRADDMILSGGENIYPAEVENALYAHPDVAEAAVVAAPHEVKGKAPVAFVVLEEGTDVSEKDLRKFTLDHVATYAHPRRIFFVDELPRSATQKVQRYKLESEAESRLGSPLEPSDEEL